MKKNEKMNFGFILVIFFLVLVAFGVVGFLFYTQNLNKTEKEKIVEKKEEEVLEKEVFDNVIRDNLAKKIAMLENIKIPNIADEQDLYMTGYLYKKDFKNNELSDEVKLFHVLENLYFEKNGNSSVTTDYDLSIFGSGNEGLVVQLEISDVENLYYDLYGSRQISYKNFKESWNCPMAIYDEKNQKYYLAAACGGTSNVNLTTYIHKYTEDDNYYYVYVRLGVIEGPADRDDYTIVYTDFERKNKYKELKDGELINGNQIITDDNYQDFSEYKYTFKKNQDETYSFDSITRIIK